MSKPSVKDLSQQDYEYLLDGLAMHKRDNVCLTRAEFEAVKETLQHYISVITVQKDGKVKDEGDLARNTLAILAKHEVKDDNA